MSGVLGGMLGSGPTAPIVDAVFQTAAYVHNLSNQKYYVNEFDETSPFGLIKGITGTPLMAGVEANFRS